MAVSDLGVGLLVSTLVYYKPCHSDKRKHSNSNFWDYFSSILGNHQNQES